MSNGIGCSGTAPPNPMIALSWNCWGLGSSQAIQVLYCLIKQFTPQLDFLMATKLSAYYWRKGRFGFSLK